MQYMVLIYIDEKKLDALPANTFDEMMRGCLTKADDLKTKGKLLDSQQLEPPSTARTIRRQGNRLAATDGPFAEAKEVLGGFNLIEAADMDEAIEIASSFPWSDVGSIEVRPVRSIDSVRARVFASSRGAQKVASAR